VDFKKAMCFWQKSLFLTAIALLFFYPLFLYDGYCVGELYKYRDKDGTWIITDKPRKLPVSKDSGTTRNYDHLLSEGHAHAKSGDFHKALDAYNKAIGQNSKDAEGYVGRGSCYAHLGNNQLAEKDFNTAIQLDPKNYQAYWNRGLLHTLLGNFNKAVDDYNKIIDLKPDFAMAYANRGWIYRNRLSKSQRAILDYTTAIKLNGGSALVYFHRAFAFLDVGKYLETVDDLTKAIDQDKDFAAAYALRGFVYQQYLGQPKKGEKDLEQAKKLSGKTPMGNQKMPFSQ